MGDEETVANPVVERRRQLFHRQPRGVGGENRVVLHTGLQPLVESDLPVQPLGDRLHDPVTLAEALQVLVVVAGRDPLQEPLMVERRRTGLRQSGDALFRELLAQIEDQGIETGAGEEGRQLAAHDTRAADSDGLDLGHG